MNKKEIAEIKKLFTPSHCAITRICGCYVDCVFSEEDRYRKRKKKKKPDDAQA